MTNIAALLGYDGLAFNTNSRQFQPINNTGPYMNRNRISVNKILPTIQNRLAKLCKNPPKFDVIPESESTEDKEAARLSLQIISALWEKLEVNQKRMFLYMWVQQTGHAYIKVFWDPTKGKLMLNPETGEMDYEGDVAIGIRSPFEVFPDPMAKTEEDLDNLTEAKVRKLDYFKMQYPEYGDLVKSEDAWLLSSQFEQRINSINARGPSQGGIQDSMKNTAIELIRYEKRSKKYPNGRMIITANGILLEDKELPTGEIPFAKFDDIIIGGKYYSESVITHLRPLQDQNNRLLRKRQQWTNQLLTGKFIAATGSDLQQESIDDQSGEIVYFTPVPTAPDGGRPIPLSIPNIPQWAYTEEDKITQQFNDISGISEVSRGTLPSAQIPAIGMQLLIESDDTRVGVMTEQHEHGWAKVGSLMLKHVEKFYIMPRKLKIAGPNLQYTVRNIVGDMIKGNTDVKVIRGSTLPGSKTLKRQEIINAYTMGLRGDPNDPRVKEKVLADLEFGDTQGIWEDVALDEAQIKRGIDKIQQGIDIPVSEFDNHAMWLLHLNRLRKGDKWDGLQPQVQMLILNHLEAHIEKLVDLSGAGVPPSPVPAPPSQSAALGAAMAQHGPTGG